MEAIRRRTEADVAYYALHPDEIDARLDELELETDIERLLQRNASTLSLAALGLSLLGWRRMLLVPLLVQGFLLQHAVDGWCPPLPVLRRLGYRTRREIEHERTALKALRGDFRSSAEAEKGDPLAGARSALQAAR
jgi:hypothetical protein